MIKGLFSTSENCHTLPAPSSGRVEEHALASRLAASGSPASSACPRRWGDHLVEEVPPRAAVTGEGDAWEEWWLASDEVADKVRLFCASSSK